MKYVHTRKITESLLKYLWERLCDAASCHMHVPPNLFKRYMSYTLNDECCMLLVSHSWCQADSFQVEMRSRKCEYALTMKQCL